MNMLSIVIALSLGVLLFSSTASGQIIVAKDGSGQFKTIGEAIQFARATGDEIIVKQGEYAESISMEGRREIKIEAEGEVTVRANGSSPAVALHKCYQIKFHGFKFNGNINIIESEDIEISGCDFTSSGIDVKKSFNLGIYGNKFSKSTPSVLVFNDSYNLRIFHNVLHDNIGKNGIHLIKSEAIIKNNTIGYNQLTPILITSLPLIQSTTTSRL
jgi:hypothetical protein